MTLQQAIANAERTMRYSMEHSRESIFQWDMWFAAHAQYFRSEIGNLIVLFGGSYSGMVGDHTLEVCGVVVSSDDGYRGLLRQWVAAARAQLKPQAVAS